jgi:peptidoglycan-associated lipoprotein
MKISKLITCLSAVLIFALNGYAQKDFAKEGDNHFRNEAYFSAITSYKAAEAKTTKPADKARYNFLIGECYRLMIDQPQAEVYYARAIKLHHEASDPTVLLRMAEVLREQGNYKDAQKNYEQFLSKRPGVKEAEDGLAACKKAQEWKNDPTKHIVQNEVQINTENFDFSPTWADKKGNSIIFSSSRPGSTGSEVDIRTGESYMDLWITSRDNKGKWDEPKLLPTTINTADNEGAAVLNAKGDVIYFTRCPRVKKENIGCDIFVSEAQGQNWKEATKLNLKPEGGDSISCGHPAIDKNEKYLIFASDLPGGIGGKDLWIVEFDKKLKSWGTPVNLGPSVNTPGDEMFPYLGEDGTLYFSSNGHIGMGGLDIFKAEAAGEKKWDKVENLRYPINSSDHDYGIIFDKGTTNRGFFTSSRAGGKGKDDIYSFNLPEIKFIFDVYVKDKEDNTPIPGVTITVVGSDGTQYVKTTDEEGKVSFDDNSGARFINKETGYSFETTRQNFLAAKGRFTTVGEITSKRFVEEVFMVSTVDKSGKKKAIDFPEVRYAYDKAELLVDNTVNSKDSLNYLYQTLIDNPNIVIELQAHTDCRGGAAYNRNLSQRRAQSCVDYLVAKGIPADRMVAKGYGLDAPRSGLECDVIKKMPTKDEQELAHAKNRRTQFIVISENYVPKN